MDIKSIIPHRAPFLFIDQVLDHTEKTLTAKKSFSGKEDFFQGHFPDRPILPGVIMTEALLQAGALLMGQGGVANNKTPVVTRVQNIKFKNLVIPPAELFISVELKESLDNVSFFKGKIKVQDKLAVSCEFSCALIDGDHQ